MAQAAAENDAAGEFGYELLEAGIVVTDFDIGLILTTSRPYGLPSKTSSIRVLEQSGKGW